MQWLCSSSGMSPITFLIAGTKRRDAVDGEQPSRVLEPDGIDLAAFHQVLRRFHVKLVGVNRRQTIRERTERLDAQRARHVDR